MKDKKIRVRFAPAPTGMMHLGNIRTALMNYLFARQKNGIFVLRIEDTDPQRNYDPKAEKIIEDLYWLGLNFDEGPEKGGPYKPYFQSQRTAIYESALKELQDKNLVYRCFCTDEELEKKRERQRALKLPPRYDRTCLHLTTEEIQDRLNKKMPFIWRFKLDHDLILSITDLAHGKVTFDMNNFSDFPITRQDGSVTFMFANFVDDMMMKITDVFRGEDHLSNTAGQAALYHAFNAPLPIFMHMPILCNIDGKKLSKRDFGFSLRDLKSAGFLPEAITNYLAIIGASYKDEIMSLAQLIKTIDFDHMSTTGAIKYDVEKLKWLNHKWIDRLEPGELTKRCKPLLQEAFPTAKNIDDAKITQLLQIIKTDLVLLNDCVQALRFYFEKPNIKTTDIDACITPDNRKPLHELISNNLSNINDHDAFVNNLKKAAKEKNIPLKELFWFVRLALIGKTHGPSIHDLLAMLGSDEAKKRLEKALTLLTQS